MKKYVRGIWLDSLKILGWKIEINNDEVFIISKPLSVLIKLMIPPTGSN
ncbi:MAG: hypothetical protein WDO16_21145 [Bacteroidota bacterium]